MSNEERWGFVERKGASIRKGPFFWQGSVYTNWWIVETQDGVFRHWDLKGAIDAAERAEEPKP